MPLDHGPAEAAYRNQVLAALPAANATLLRPHLARVTLVATQVLHEAGAMVDEVYFIESGLVALVADTGDDGQVQVGLTGWEGLVGTAALLDPGALATHRSIVRVPGSAYRMRTVRLRELMDQSPALRDRCLRHVHVMMTEALQSAPCNAHHGLPARLTRLLLTSCDRIGSDELPMTQEALSHMLGVRRAGVSVVAHALESRGLVRQSQGHLTLLDRAGLEARACSCYRRVEASQKQLRRACVE